MFTVTQGESMSEMEELIKKYLNDKGKLDCSDAYKIAAKLKCPICGHEWVSRSKAGRRLAT